MRRFCTGVPVMAHLLSRGELPGGDGLTHVGVLDVVSLVEHNPEPLNLVEHGALVGGEGPVGGDDDVVAGQLVRHLGL